MIAPEFKITRIYSQGVDEWYGVQVDLDWSKPFTYEEWLASPGMTIEKLRLPLTAAGKIDRAVEKERREQDFGFARAIAYKVRESAEWKAYWKSQHSVVVETLDGERRKVDLTERLTERDGTLEWSFSETGGWISWSSRDD